MADDLNFLDNSSDNMESNPVMEATPSVQDSPIVSEQKEPISPSYYSAMQAPQYQQPSPQYQQPAPQYQQPISPIPPYQQPPYPPINPANPPYNYYQQQRPGYVPTYYPAVTPPHAGDGLGVASLVLGILSLVLFWIPFLNCTLAIVGLILGIVAKVKGSRGFAVAGIILGSIGLVLAFLIILMIFVGAMYSANNYDSFYYEEWNSFTANFLFR